MLDVRTAWSNATLGRGCCVETRVNPVWNSTPVSPTVRRYPQGGSDAVYYFEDLGLAAAGIRAAKPVGNFPDVGF
jgi:hypothetical protein